MSRLRLFFDAESQLAQEAQQDVNENLGREFLGQEGLDLRQAHQRLAQESTLRQRLVQLWVDQQPSSFARRWLGLHRAISVGLLVIGFVLGALACQAALWSAPGQVINLWRALAILVALPFLTTLLTLGFLVGSRLGGGTWRGFGQSLLQLWSRKGAAKHLPEAARRDFFHHSLPMEQKLWLRQTQLFSCFLQLGMVLCFAARVWFSELQFGWSTTTEQGHEAFLEFVVEVCSAPWAWLLAPENLPAPEVIANTRWDPLARQYLAPFIDGRVWWPFLFGSLVFWGLLPRTLLWLYSHLQLRRAVRALSWSHRGYQDLFQRALPLPQASSSDERLAVEALPETNAQPGRELLVWGAWAKDLAQGLQQADAPTARLGLNAQDFLTAGVALTSEKEAINALQKSPPTGLWILVEAGESPDKRFLHFLGMLREALGSQFALHVWPLEFSHGSWQGASERDMEVWSRTLAARHDRYLHLHREGEA